MSQEQNVRSVLPHPPKAIPNYFMASAFEGAQIAEPGKPKSRLLELYDQLAPSYFASIPEDLGDADLDWLERFLTTRLEIEREERRMHFGALALVGILFFLLLPQIVAMEFANLALNLLALLLLALVVPYVFVYFGYENRVRAMALARLRLIEARTARASKPAQSASGSPQSSPSSAVAS
ncbi:MAG: hypothetical protein ACOX6T_21010 [Myxococcales bacterium]|jgi:hypothetical protein